jgi:L-asparaginase / beta-aspartyl-peptidase
LSQLNSKFNIVIHGGAGTIRRELMTDEREREYRSGLESALKKGFEILAAGGKAMDAIIAAVVILEDHELFNAGKGSVFAHDGSQEMDASIMDGSNLMAGAVSAVRNVRNPVLLAHKIMTQSQHVMLSGQGAYEFAVLHGLKIEPDDYFFVQHRYEQWKKMKETDEIILDHTPLSEIPSANNKFGTVGACALDVYGNIAAATSTGGMTNKQFGRVGDSPIIGAGTYANNRTCAISCTGHGEPFIRAVTAYDVSCLMEYKGLTLIDAMNVVVHDKLMQIDGEGGMIGVDAKGNIGMVFNSEGMYRGFMENGL